MCCCVSTTKVDLQQVEVNRMSTSRLQRLAFAWCRPIDNVLLCPLYDLQVRRFFYDSVLKREYGDQLDVKL